MAVTIGMYANDIPFLDSIMHIHMGVAKESLSVAGNHVRVKARLAFAASQKTHWSFKIIDGKRVLTYQSRYKRLTGQRMVRATGAIDDPSNLSNFIVSKLYEKPMKVVIGGMHKGGPVQKYKDGLPNGFTKIHGVSKSTFEILERLDQGKTVQLTKKQQNLLKNTEVKKWSKRLNKFIFVKPFFQDERTVAKYRKRNFMRKGFLNARGLIQDSMTTRYEKLVGKRVESLKLKVEKVA